MKKNFLNVIALLLTGLFLISCSGEKKEDISTGAQDGTGKIKVRVGTEGTFAPFSYMDDKDNLTGYDIEVVKEIGKRANIEFEFLPTPWDGMFLGLESGKFDMIANQISKNPEREKKYLFSNDYLITGAQIIVKKGRTDIKTLEDFKGKRIMTSVGSDYNKIMTEYDKDKKFKLQYYDGEVTVAFDEIAQGRADATINDRLTVGYFVKKRGDIVEAVGEVIEKSPAHMIVRKGEDKLREEINEGIKEMKSDGTLSNLSKKWFGEDYTK